MKIAGKRIARGSLLMTLGMAVVAVCALLMSAALRANYINEIRHRDFFSSKARKFELSNSSMDSSGWRTLFAQCGDGFALYHQIVDEELDVRAVYGTCSSAYLPLKNGRFFEEQDQFQETPAAVIGQNYADQLLTADGQNYFEWMGMRFLVLGILGGRWESRVDDLILIDFASGIDLASSDGQYILDAKDSRDMELCLELIEEEPEAGQIAISVEDEPQTVTERLHNGRFGSVLYGLLYLCFFFSVVLMVHTWLGYRRRMICVMQMLGFGKSQIFFEMNKKYFRITVVGWAAGMLAAFIVSYCLPVLDLNVTDMMISFAVTIVTGAAALAALFCKQSAAGTVWK